MTLLILNRIITGDDKSILNAKRKRQRLSSQEQAGIQGQFFWT